MNNKKNNSVVAPPLLELPQSIEAEQAVIGALFGNEEAWDKIIGVLQENDFYRPEHRVIFRAINQLLDRSRAIDIISLNQFLKDKQEIELVGGEVYLYELYNNAVGIANIVTYANMVRERSILRQLATVAQEIGENATRSQGREVSDILDQAESKIFSISNLQAQFSSGPQSLTSLMAKAYDRIDFLYKSKGSLTGLPTGFIDLDNLTSGLQPSDLIIIAGRPSMGKTVLGINIAENAAIKHGAKVLVFSMEMPGDSIAMRILSSLGSVEQHSLRSGKLEDSDWINLRHAVEETNRMNIFIDETPALSPMDLRSRARRLVRERGKIDLIVIDYLQLMHVPGIRADNRVAEISEISRSLKILARELHVPVIALSQLNRGLENRTDKRPTMSDLRDSGAIEQDADIIAFIYRDEVYNESSPDKGIAEIIIAKHRNGPIGKIRMLFEGKYTRFRSLAREREGLIGTHS